MARTDDDEAHVELKTCHIGSRRTENEYMIVQEEKSAIKELVRKEPSNMVEDPMEDILRMSFHNPKNCI